jgi:FkbM family methyltransferase
LTPEEHVAALFRLALEREPDPDGARHWLAVLERHGAATVLEGLLGSAEYRRRTGGDYAMPAEALARLVAALDGRSLTVVDVGAQNLASEDHVYGALRAAGVPHRVIGFEPLADRLAERARSDADEALTLLPYAIGDGAEHTLHVNNDDATSSLFPLNAALNRDFERLSHLATVRRETVRTRRLDDVLPADEAVDFLKLDIQGAELLALRGAERTLTRTAVVHCEVEFSPLYRGQPLFPEVQGHLNARGFALVDLLVAHRYSHRVPSGRVAPDRLIWADAVFFREDVGDDPAALLAQALAALLVYRKPTLAEHLLQRHDALAGENLAALMA